MKKALRLLALISVIIFAFISCDENQNLIINPETPTPTIRGTVSIPEGSGFTGSDFFIRIMEGEKAVYTGRVNADGSFSVPGLSEEATYSILLTTEEPGDIKGTEKDISRATKTSGMGGWLSNVTASINEQAGVGSVKVKPLGTIKGVVTKDGAEDGYDTTVYIPGTSFLAMTDGQGNFSIFNVPQATYTLRYISNGYMAKMVSDVVLYSDSDTENPVTTVETQKLIKNAGNLVGNITKTGSADHSSITVMLSDGENTYTGSTATDGSMMITGITPGTYIATISSSGFVTQTVEEIKVEAAKNTMLSPISLTANGGTITGSVVMNDGGEKTGVLITAKSSDNKYSYTTSADANGEFIISNAYPGIYTLSFSKAGYAASSIADVASTAGQASDVGRITMLSLYGSISGKVSLSESTDNSGVTVTLTYVADMTVAPATISGADGTYTFGNLTDAGQYTIAFSKDGYVSSVGNYVTVTLGQNTSVDDITLRSLTSKVNGKVTLEGTEDYTGVSVLLKATDNSVQYDATTDQQGNYVMARVTPGEYTLTVSKTGYVAKTVTDIIVESSTEKTLDNVSLNIGTRSVSGNVTLELRSDYSGALISATNLSNPKDVYSAISNTAGDYTLAGMKPGEYVISVSCAGYNTATLPTINITEGTETTLDSFELKIARGTISGTATLEGRGTNAGVTVELLKGTDVYDSTVTDDSGAYAFNVPQGNYSGVRLTCENFKSVSIAQDIALIANNQIVIGQNADMIATHVPVVRGRLTVKNLLSLDYSDIAVTLVENGMTTTTDKDGYWSFTKVPVGHYTLKFERENTNPVTMAVNIVAAAEKNIETIELIPNAASIEGNVTLNGLTDYSGITVRATAEGMAELSTKTNAAGYFYIGNIVTTETYTVHFEKAGWVSQTREVSGLEDLSINDITEGNPVKLVDTTAPVLNSISITVGNSEFEGRKLNVYINATEEGSGINNVFINTTNDFEGVEPISFANLLSCHVTDAEGFYTLYVKIEDKSGNQSATVSQAFSIADYKTVVSGVQVDNEDGVNDGVITWTKAKSPYYVTGDIFIDEDTTLIIESGVNVQFSGAYYMQIEGTIKINGTENEQVYLYGVGTGENTWWGINGVYDNDSMISFASISGMIDGLQGYVNIKSSTIVAASNGFALGKTNKYYNGKAEDCAIAGKIRAKGISLLNCSIDTMAAELTGGDWSEPGSNYIRGCIVQGTEISIKNALCENNSFSNASIRFSASSSIYSSFNDCTLYFLDGGVYLYDEFIGCSFGPGFNSIKLSESNIIDFGRIDVATNRADIETIDFSNNFWGYDNTGELVTATSNTNLSFINDFYDDFNITKVVYESFVTSPYTGIGYLGDNYGLEVDESTKEYSIGDVGPGGGIVFYDKGFYSEGWRYIEAGPEDLGSYLWGFWRTTSNGSNSLVGTAYDIGCGRINTLLWMEVTNGQAYELERNSPIKISDYAAMVCDSYVLNGFDDWYLPSYGELEAMYNNLHLNGLGGFTDSMYWSSTERPHPSNSESFDFKTGTYGTIYRNYARNVRPVRYF